MKGFGKSEITETFLCNMDFHETILMEPDTEIMRVDGGWIYTKIRLDAGQMSSVFVPERN